jgi:hypothetical protein
MRWKIFFGKPSSENAAKESASQCPIIPAICALTNATLAG